MLHPSLIKPLRNLGNITTKFYPSSILEGDTGTVGKDHDKESMVLPASLFGIPRFFRKSLKVPALLPKIDVHSESPVSLKKDGSRCSFRKVHIFHYDSNTARPDSVPVSRSENIRTRTSRDACPQNTH